MSVGGCSKEDCHVSPFAIPVGVKAIARLCDSPVLLIQNQCLFAFANKPLAVGPSELALRLLLPAAWTFLPAIALATAG